MKHVIRVEPSSHHQQILVAGHLLLGWLAWQWLHGHYWSLFLLAWGLSLGWSLYQAHHRRGSLVLSGSEILWRGRSYSLGTGSRLGHGFLWLDLQGERSLRLWLFADSLTEADYRRLARHIHLQS